MDDRRQETRKDCEIPVVIHAPDEQGGFFEETTIIENYSPTGACIRLSRKVLPGTLMVMSARYYPLEGTVKVNTVWQEEQDGILRAGVAFLHPDENWLMRLYPIR